MMTQETWNKLSSKEKDALRDNSDLSPQLVGLEGYRVEVESTCGEVRRFIVGKSTGWIPSHLEIKTSRSRGGDLAEKNYKSVKIIEKVR